MKKIKAILRMSMTVALIVVVASCKKDESGPTGTDNPENSPYGSGSISFSTNVSGVGNFNISGGFNPDQQVGTGTVQGVMAWIDTSTSTANAYGVIMRSTSDMDIALLQITNLTGGIPTAGTYSFGENLTNNLMATMGFGKNLNGTADQVTGTYYILTQGTCVVTSLTSTGMKGTFSGSGVVTVGGEMTNETFTVSNGTFDVNFGQPGF